MTALLEVRTVTKRYGGIRALDAVSLEVHPGEAVGLIGPNGAGKTTLFDCITGVQRADAGEIFLAETRIDELPIYRRARLGIARTFQRIELFGGMTARDTLLVAEREHRGDGRLWKDLLWQGAAKSEELDRVEKTIAELGIEPFADAPIESLSLGQGRLVELGRALITDPKLILLDEPSSGLDTRESAGLAAVLNELRQRRETALLLVEHDLDLVHAVAERAYVIDFGRMIASGTLQDVLAEDRVRTAYLGEGVVSGRQPLTPPGETPAGETPAGETAGSGVALRVAAPDIRVGEHVPPPVPALELRGVSAAYGRLRALFDVSFSLAEGSVGAMLGPNGAGKSTIARVITGLVPATSGAVLLEGRDVTGIGVRRIVHDGLSFAPEGRPVFATLDVEDNLRLTFFRQLPRREAAAALDRTYEQFPLLKTHRRQLAGTLSGGEQRILALARVLAVPPKVLVVDELSLGLSPRAVDDVFAALRKIKETGTTVLVVEQQVPRALALADQVIVLRKGRVVHDVPVAEMPSDLAAELLPVAL